MPGNWIADLKAEISMVDLVGIWVDLKRVGNCYKGLCPFHPDKETPSLTVYRDHAHCFGCSGHWDQISWIGAKLDLNFRDAVKWLQDRTGVIPKAVELPHSRLYTPTSPIPMTILEYWHNLVTKEVREYFYNRCLTDDTVDLYMLGYDGTNYVIPIWEGAPRESLVYGAKFRCPEGVVPKYFGLRGRNQPRLFNKFVLEDADEAIILFGEFDAILAHQLGFVAVSPTSGQNTWQVGWTKLFDGIETIFVLPDRGERAAGYSLLSLFGARGVLCEFPDNLGVKDFTEFVQMGYTVQDLRSAVLYKLTNENDFDVKSYWEESDE